MANGNKTQQAERKNHWVALQKPMTFDEELTKFTQNMADNKSIPTEFDLFPQNGVIPRKASHLALITWHSMMEDFPSQSSKWMSCCAFEWNNGGFGHEWRIFSKFLHPPCLLNGLCWNGNAVSLWRTVNIKRWVPYCCKHQEAHTAWHWEVENHQSGHTIGASAWCWNMMFLASWQRCPTWKLYTKWHIQHNNCIGSRLMKKVDLKLDWLDHTKHDSPHQKRWTSTQKRWSVCWNC